jgi:hypothetical protein
MRRMVNTDDDGRIPLDCLSMSVTGVEREQRSSVYGHQMLELSHRSFE